MSERKFWARPSCGILLVLSGPSGAGKGTLCKALLQKCPELTYSISVTTRSPRPGENHGVNYFFLSTAEFQDMAERGELLEWAQVYDHYYGTPRKFVEETLASGRDIILEIDIQGARQIKEKFPAGVFVFVMPPSLEELAVRIVKRGADSEEEIRKRLSCASDELSHVTDYDYVVLNDEVTRAVEKLKAILIAERCRVSRQIFHLTT
ncbi:MAG: guanylate kinase [Firmicutes bacterium]|nr:guanylate kinase [Bacillota bacterium]